MRFLVFAAMVLGCGSCWGEVGCFKTVAQAAVQVGEQEGGGFRLEFVRVDRISGRSWAGVRSCVHPEWPPVLVPGIAPVLGSSSRLNADKAGVETSRADIVGGRTVRVVKADAMVRLEMSGVAQASGRVGDRIWVRVLGPGDDHTGHLELAVVRSAELLEIGQ